MRSRREKGSTPVANQPSPPAPLPERERRRNRTALTPGPSPGGRGEGKASSRGHGGEIRRPLGRAARAERASPSTRRRPARSRAGRGGRKSSACRWPGTIAAAGTCPFAPRRAKATWNCNPRWTPCGRCWKTRRSAKIGQNLKYDMIVLRAAGIALAGVTFDTMVASYLLDAGQRNHNLNDLAKRYLNHATIKIEELIGSGKNQKRMDAGAGGPGGRLRRRGRLAAGPPAADPGREARRGRADRSAGRPRVAAGRRAGGDGIHGHQGGRGPAGRIEPTATAERMAALEQEIYELAGRQFNIASPKQLQELLFVEKKLPVIEADEDRPEHRRGRAGGAGPAASVAGEDRRISPIRQAQGDLRGRPAGDGPSRRPAGSTPRSTRSWPPRAGSAPAIRTCKTSPCAPTRGGKSARPLCPAQEGWLLLAADYSQIELRILAHFSGDERLCEAFAARRRHPRPRGQPGQRRPAGPR